MRRLSLALALLFVLPGSLRAARRVVVRGDSWLYLAPKDTADKVRARSVHRDGEYLAFRLIKRGKTWTTVETMDDETADCYDWGIGVSDYRIRFAVRTADLVPVTTRQFKAKFSDGTSLRLSAGVALEPDGDGFRVALDDLRFRVAIPARQVGAQYDPAQVEVADYDPPTGRLMSTKPVTLDGAEVELDRARLLTPLPNGRARVARRCAALEVAAEVDEPDASASVGGPTAALTGLTGVSPQRVIPKGRPVYFASGARAGRARREVLAGAFVARGDRLCSQYSLFADGDPDEGTPVELCVRERDTRMTDELDGGVAGGVEGGVVGGVP
jgi:hypothetical protein